MGKLKSHMRKIVIGIAGGAVVIVGITAIPYPGPGWLIVFAGLAILASEFEWAHRLLVFARGKYDGWTEWVKRQHRIVQLLILAMTGLVVVTTIWLVNGFGIVNSVLHLPFNWIKSPLF